MPDIDAVRFLTDDAPKDTLGRMHSDLRQHDLLFAVCTNGRRDRCCAIVGRGIAVDLHAEFGDQVVEISHLGGHRYAGTMLVLPRGYAYGFLDPATARTVAAAAVAGLVHPEGLRGRADLPPAALLDWTLSASSALQPVAALRIECPRRCWVFGSTS